MATPLRIMFLDIDMKINLPTTPCRKGILNGDQITCHHGKEITGLWEWILPTGKMAMLTSGTIANEITVGKENRNGEICLDGRGETGHDIRAVKIIGYLAKALGLTLGAKITT
jgi:hypothetical protein